MILNDQIAISVSKDSVDCKHCLGGTGTGDTALMGAENEILSFWSFEFDECRLVSDPMLFCGMGDFGLINGSFTLRQSETVSSIEHDLLSIMPCSASLDDVLLILSVESGLDSTSFSSEFGRESYSDPKSTDIC